MKTYTVYYIIKANGHGYLKSRELEAKTQKEAIQTVKDEVREETGKFAFSATCKTPVRVKEGLQYNGGTYTRYSEFWGWLW